MGVWHSIQIVDVVLVTLVKSQAPIQSLHYKDKRLWDFWEIFDKATMKSRMSKTRSYSLHRCLGRQFLNNLNIGHINLNPSLRDLMTKDNAIFNHKVTFLLINNKIHLLTSLHNFLEVGETNVKWGTYHGKIIHEYFYGWLKHIQKKWQSLTFGRSIA